MHRSVLACLLLAIAAPANAAITLYTLSDFHLRGLFATVTATGSFTMGQPTQAQETSDVTVVETQNDGHGGIIQYSYHLSGPIGLAGWGPLPSQQPVFCFPGFGCQNPQPAYFSLGVINPGPGATAASFEDNLQLATGFGTVTASTYVPGVPEPASWALLLAGFGLIGLASRRRALA